MKAPKNIKTWGEESCEKICQVLKKMRTYQHTSKVVISSQHNITNGLSNIASFLQCYVQNMSQMTIRPGDTGNKRWLTDLTDVQLGLEEHLLKVGTLKSQQAKVLNALVEEALQCGLTYNMEILSVEKIQNIFCNIQGQQFTKLLKDNHITIELIASCINDPTLFNSPSLVNKGSIQRESDQAQSDQQPNAALNPPQIEDEKPDEVMMQTQNTQEYQPAKDLIAHGKQGASTQGIQNHYSGSSAFPSKQIQSSGLQDTEMKHQIMEKPHESSYVEVDPQQQLFNSSQDIKIILDKDSFDLTQDQINMSIGFQDLQPVESFYDKLQSDELNVIQQIEGLFQDSYQTKFEQECWKAGYYPKVLKVRLGNGCLFVTYSAIWDCQALVREMLTIPNISYTEISTDFSMQ